MIRPPLPVSARRCSLETRYAASSSKKLALELDLERGLGLELELELQLELELEPKLVLEIELGRELRYVSSSSKSLHSSPS